MKGFLSRELRGGLPPGTEGRRFSSRDALPCARTGGQGVRRAGAGSQARAGRASALTCSAGGLQQEHAKSVHTVQKTLSVRAPVCAGYWERAGVDSET